MRRYQPKTGELVLIVSPHVKPDGAPHPNKFDARLSNSDDVLTVSDTPMFDGARLLLRTRARSGDRLVMRHAGSPHDALRATVGAAAGSTVEETGFGPRRRRYSPRPTGVAPRIAPDEGAGNPLQAAVTLIGMDDVDEGAGFGRWRSLGAGNVAGDPFVWGRSVAAHFAE